MVILFRWGRTLNFEHQHEIINIPDWNANRNGTFKGRSKYFANPFKKDWRSTCVPKSGTEFRNARSWSAILPKTARGPRAFYFGLRETRKRAQKLNFEGFFPKNLGFATLTSHVNRLLVNLTYSMLISCTLKKDCNRYLGQVLVGQRVILRPIWPANGPGFWSK